MNQARARPLRWRLVLMGGLLVALGLLNVSRIGAPVHGGPNRSDATGVSRGPTLRVLTLNTLHGFPRFEDLDARLGLIAESLRLEQPDMVCLQEIGWTPRLGNSATRLAEATGYGYVYARANGNRRAIFFEEGEAILSRHPIHKMDVVELRPRVGAFEHRIALIVVVETPLGKLRVISTHLNHGNPEVNAQQATALALLARDSSYPTVICGDLNAEEDSMQVEMLTESMVDTYRDANPDGLGLTCCIDDLADPNRAFAKRIDYILLTRESLGDLRVRAAQTVLDQPQAIEGRWLWPSDHGGVLTELMLRD